MFSDIKATLKRINPPLPQCYNEHFSFFEDMDNLLLSAAKDGHSHCMKLLVAAGANVNTVDRKSRTPLSLVYDNLRRTDSESEVKKLASALRLLLRAGAHVNVKNKNGDSLLHPDECQSEYAARKLLLAAGEKVPESAMKESKEKSTGKRKKNSSKTGKSSDLAEICMETLQGQCREIIRKHLVDVSPVNLFCTVPQLGLSSDLSRYILRGFSLDETVEEDGEDNEKENPKNEEEIQRVEDEDSSDKEEEGKIMYMCTLKTQLGCARFDEFWQFLTEQVFTLPL